MTRTIDRRRPQRLPRTFDGLAAELAPQAIADDAHHARMVEMIDRLMAAGRLLRGQRVYLETLVQLVEAYEATHDAIDIGAVSGRDALAHLLEAHGLNASDLARLLGVHPSMGSKILAGERALTVGHIRRLARRFAVSAELFID